VPGTTLASTLRTLRQPRYAALSMLMVVVALVCVAAGSWQIARFDGKVVENDRLRANAHADPISVSRLLPLTSAHASVSADKVQYRTVTASGTYDADRQSLVRNRSVGGHAGFLVVTPLHTARADLLVVRGFLKAPTSGGPPAMPTAPAGPVTVRARVQLAESRQDGAASLSGGQVESINPADQQLRLGKAVYDGYAELLPGQPGTSGITAIPRPSLSNPAGGAIEPQHFAYIIQWYLFALLALAAPLAMARAERRELAATDFDDTPAVPATEPAGSVADDPDPLPDRAARLADRYGRTVP
jgi:cytochrome oxidase assembly protein ShyY1